MQEGNTQAAKEVAINVDGTEYPLSGFSDQVRRLIDVRNIWINQLDKERLDVAKTESAIQGLETQLTNLVKAELATPAAE